MDGLDAGTFTPATLFTSVPDLFDVTRSDVAQVKRYGVVGTFSMVRDQMMNEEAVRRLFEVVADEYVTRGHWAALDVGAYLQGELLWLLENVPVRDVSLIGSGWRLLNFVAAGSKRENELLAAGGLLGSRVPVEVQARAKETLGERYDRSSRSIAARATKKYRDLRDLPADLIIATVAAQPLPDEWFVDVLRMPAGLKWSAPGIPVVGTDITDG